MADTSSRLHATLSALDAIHSTDPSHPNSLEYHHSLSAYSRQLVAPNEPSEALVLAANAQHVARWKRPRGDYPEGLSGYKMWRTALNKYHADILHQVMRSSGYSEEQDAELFTRTRDLLLKRTLQRPPLPVDVSLLKDPEAHLFEDAICLTFLARDFASFAAEYQPAPSSPTATATSTDSSDPSAKPPRAGGLSKLRTIVSRTWAKMTTQGREVAVRDLVGTLEEELRAVVIEAVGACEEGEREARALQARGEEGA
ncbi:hypothetical protein JCM10908_003631 [Rhodotorula pacifica]|uniref:uncharacterized protein n=1 Tax=Rhodotorula pacifica TaxID=1495444 RepID=UPI00316E7363